MLKKKVKNYYGIIKLKNICILTGYSITQIEPGGAPALCCPAGAV